MSSISIHSLPPEILNRILDFVASEDDEYGRPEVQDVLEVTARVCKRWSWHTIATRLLYENIQLRSLDSLILLTETLLHHNPSRAKLVKRFTYWNNEDNEPTPLLCRRFLTCNFPAMQAMELDPAFTRFLSVPPSVSAMEVLKSLSISGETLPMLNGMAFHHLENLTLRNFNEAARTHHPSFPSLRTLSLERVAGYPTVCNWLKHAIPKLHTLSVRFAGVLPGDSSMTKWPNLVGSLPEDLEEVIFHIGNMHPDTLPFHHGLGNLPHLRKLEIHSNGNHLDLLRLVHMPSSIEILELSFRTISDLELWMFFRKLQGSGHLPNLSAIPRFGVAYKGPPLNDRMKEECQKTYASLVNRGLEDIWSKDPSSLWNTESRVWKVSEQEEAPEDDLIDSSVEDEQELFSE